MQVKLPHMTVPAGSRTVQTFADRGEALGHFFQRAGEAPRLVSYDDEVGCPLINALAALEWTMAVGILEESDLVHAARLSGETAAALVERRRGDRRSFIYFGPRMDTSPVEPYEGTLLFDQPGVRAFEFAQRALAHAHFLRATQGAGAVISLLSRRAPELRHIRRWLGVLFESPAPMISNQLLATWFATTGAGFLFVPGVAGEPWVYEEVGLEP